MKTTVQSYKAVNGTAPASLPVLVRPHPPAGALRSTPSAGGLVPPSLRASQGPSPKTQLGVPPGSRRSQGDGARGAGGPGGTAPGRWVLQTNGRAEPLWRLTRGAESCPGPPWSPERKEEPFRRPTTKEETLRGLEKARWSTKRGGAWTQADVTIIPQDASLSTPHTSSY